MKYLALIVPGLNGSPAAVSAAPGFKANEFTNLGSLVSSGLNLTFMIAGFVMLFWFSWGVFQYIFAGGSKEALAKARGRLTWAIVGFIFLTISFAISQYAQKIFPTNNNLTPAPVSRSNGSNNICTQQIIQDCEAADAKSKCAIVDGKPRCVPR